MYKTLYLKLAKLAECSSRRCKISYRHLKLQIVIEVSNQLFEKCVEPGQAVCSSLFSLFVSRILEAVFSSLR